MTRALQSLRLAIGRALLWLIEPAQQEHDAAATARFQAEMERLRLYRLGERP